jgi:hypothetical protein
MALAALFALTSVSSAEAQQRGGYLARQGFTFGVGGGYGSLGVACEGCTVDRENGVSGRLLLGTAINPRMVVGLETNGFYKKFTDDVNDELTMTSGQVGVVLNYYPSATGNLYVRGSAGYSVFTLADVDADGDGIDDGDITANGFGFGVGLGYDFYLSKSTSITPYFNYLIALNGDAEFAGTSTNFTLKPNLWQVGAAVVFH